MELLDNGYKWFVTDKNELIGIHEKELTSKDLSLLTTFLSPYSVTFPLQTEEEKKWKSFIYPTECLVDKPFKLDNKFRLIYFSYTKSQLEPILFKEALQELFGKRVPILWKNEHEGVIIEQQADVDEEKISYEHMMDVLMSDLYVKIKFFVGPYKNNFAGISDHYITLANLAEKVFLYTNKSVWTVEEAIPYILVKEMDPDFRLNICTNIFREFLQDEETTTMIQTFFRCNLNLSETSKALHMHRNSLQYRLDRLLDKTGIDIRQFQHAMTVQLALLSKK